MAGEAVGVADGGGPARDGGSLGAPMGLRGQERGDDGRRGRQRLGTTGRAPGDEQAPVTAAVASRMKSPAADISASINAGSGSNSGGPGLSGRKSTSWYMVGLPLVAEKGDYRGQCSLIIKV
jgi:hypothetical protein